MYVEELTKIIAINEIFEKLVWIDHKYHQFVFIAVSNVTIL